MMKTLNDLEALPPVEDAQNACMRCGASIHAACCEVIVYRLSPEGPNLTFEQARTNSEVNEYTVAHICFDCNALLYNQ